MKSFLALALLLEVGASFAGTMRITSVDVPKRMTSVETRFVVNAEGKANAIAVDVTRAVPGPQGMSLPAVTTTVVEVPELMLMGDTLTLLSRDGNVDCGEMGKTRVLRRPVLRLSGNCAVKATVNGRKIDVDLVFGAN